MEAELDTENLQDQVKRLKQQLEESESACRNSDARAERLAETAAEADHLRDELKSFREDASRFSREDDRRIRHLQREKEDSNKKIRRLKSEVAELRAVIEQYVGKIKNGLEGGATSALHTELDLVRQQAETDVNRMREQLKARELNESAGSAELDVLRREFESLQQRGEAHREALEQANSEQQQLREEIEAQRSEIQRLQRALDIAREAEEKSEGRRRDQSEIRRQVEANLNDARSELELLRKRKDVAAAGLKGKKSVFDTAASMRRHSSKMALMSALAAFLIAEGISIVSGRGELITGLARKDPQESEFGFPLMERAESTRPNLTSEWGAAKNSKSVDVSPEESQPETNLSQVDSGTATVRIIRDRLRVGGKGPVMARIHGGDFNMGQKHDQLATDERPLHPVSLKQFAIGKYEVTFDEYRVFARSTGRRMPSDQGWGGGQRPIINVSWKDAAAYAGWLASQTGVTYRLPTEAEWEYAASGGTDSFYWWGYTLGENRASCFDCGSRWDGKSTAPVGSFPANQFSLNDTAGNVMEWVADCYHENYQGAPKDGTAWVEKRCTHYVARGGAYNKPGDSMHSTRRFSFQPDTKLPILGFRVARDVD